MGQEEQKIEVTLLKWRNEASSTIAEAIQKLLTDGSSIDVRVRCSDHQPSDGLGAHKLVLAAASPHFMRHLLPDTTSDDEMICVHLPDFNSMEVGPVMSLLYFGEIWINETCVHIYQKILDTLQIRVDLIFDASSNLYSLVPRNSDGYNSYHLHQTKGAFFSPDDSQGNGYGDVTVQPEEENVVNVGVRVKCEESLTYSSGLESFDQQTTEFMKRNLSVSESYVCKVELDPDEVEEPPDPGQPDVTLDLKSLKREPVEHQDAEDVSCGVSACDVLSDTEESYCQNVVNEVACEETGCSFSTSSLSSLQSHRLVHQRKRLLRELKLTCPICQEMASSQKSLKSHFVELHGEEEGDKIQCLADESCNESFDQKDRFFEHISTCHSNHEAHSDRRRLYCDFSGCFFVTEKSWNLTQHLRQHNDERTFPCSVCGLKFRSSSHVKVHYRTRHSSIHLQSYSCTLCDKNFASFWQLKIHSKRHEGDEIGPQYKCSHCENVFEKSQSLAGHVRAVHRHITDANRKVTLICENCGQVMASSAMLNKHKCKRAKLFTPDIPTETPMSVCPVCRKEISANSLKNHLHYHKVKQERTNVCQVCQRSFTTINSLQRHVLIHENAKPFKCQVCDKSFRQRGSLISHQRVHSGVRYSCSGCGQRFITNSLLNQHMKRKKECKRFQLHDKT